MSEKYIWRHLNNSADCETVDQNYHALESQLTATRKELEVERLNLNRYRVSLHSMQIERDRYREALKEVSSGAGILFPSQISDIAEAALHPASGEGTEK